MDRKQAGFSLIELVVGIVLLVIIMAGIAPLFTTLLAHGLRGTELNDRQQEGRWVVGMMAQEIRYATKINTAELNSKAIDFIKKDSKRGSVRIRYELAAAAGGNYVLQRSVWIPATAEAVSAVSPVGNPDRGFVAADGFAVTVKRSEDDRRSVTQVNLAYKLGANAADANPVITQTAVFPLNEPL